MKIVWLIFSVLPVLIESTCTRCNWSSWGPWSTCSRTCGGKGTQWRNRKLCCATSWSLSECLQNCDKDYSGFDESRQCGSDICYNGGILLPWYGCQCSWNYEGFCCETDAESCDNRCHWTSWGSWSTCSHTCGSGGYQSRSRRLCCDNSWDTNKCLQNCNLDISGFDEYRDCGSAFCLNGGTYGSSWLSSGCNCLWNFEGFCCEADLQPCDNRCHWTSWGSWSTCSHTCGSGGLQSRSRGLCCEVSWDLNECLQNCIRDYSGFNESRDCDLAFCLNGRTYGSPLSSSECYCLWNFEGLCCEDEKAHIGLPGNTGCTSGLCNWTPWESWDSCSVTCGGGGSQQRERFMCCPEGSSYDYCLQKCGISSTESRISNRSCGDTCLLGGTIKPEKWGCDCLDRTFGHCCEEVLPGCLPFPTDVIFVLDSSASQTKVQFKSQLDFINKFIDNVNISFSEFQISVITFSWDAKIEIEFNQSESRAVLKSLVNQIPFRPGITNTHEGLRMAINVARNNERRKGMVSFTYAIVLTDGMSSNRLETKQAAKELKSLNIHVIAIGIGHQVSQEELREISSPGDSKASSYVFSAGDFNALDTMLKQLVDVTCDECIRSYLSDVVFLIDNEGLTNNEFQDTIDTVTHIVRQMSHFGKDDGIRIGVERSSTEVQTVISLNEKNTLDEALVLLQRLTSNTDYQVCEKKDPDCGNMNITISINYTLTEMEKYKREDARQFLVVLTSGRFHNVKTVEKEVSALRNESFVKMFAIGPGLNVEMEGLLSLVNEASHVYIIKENNDLSNLDVLQTEFSYNVCTKSDDQT